MRLPMVQVFIAVLEKEIGRHGRLATCATTAGTRLRTRRRDLRERGRREAGSLDSSAGISARRTSTLRNFRTEAGENTPDPRGRDGGMKNRVSSGGKEGQRRPIVRKCHFRVKNHPILPGSALGRPGLNSGSPRRQSADWTIRRRVDYCAGKRTSNSASVTLASEGTHRST